VLNHLANSNEATNQSADGDEEGPLDRIGKLADKISEQWNDPRIQSADRYKDEMPPPIEKDAEPSTPREPLEKYDPPQPGRVPEAVWPEGMPPMVSPVPNPRIREQDDYGNGGFGMPRDNGTRSHKGVDIIAEAGEKVTSPVSGKVVAVYDPYQNMKDKNGNPSQHKDKFKAIDIVTEDGKTVQILYVNVDKDKFPNGTVVKAGETELGAAQDLSVAYPTKKHHQNGGMTNHIHLAVIDKNGDRIDPSGAIGVWNSE
jgi:murein DD-endopeptidase MepM/ murein hydrolase activator NlpD